MDPFAESSSDTHFARPTARPLRVLVVDDDPNARSALCELLADEGYEVQSASDGLAALATLERFRADVVLTDVRMPRMSGLELLRALRGRGEDAPRVILMSANAQVPADGDARFLAKPISYLDLLALL